MAMTNAERQRRYRERLKARAAPGAVVDLVRVVVAEAIAALWAFHERPVPGRPPWRAIDGCLTLEDYLADLAREPGNLVEAARALLPDGDGLSPDETAALRRLVECADVLALADPARPPATAVTLPDRAPVRQVRTGDAPAAPLPGAAQAPDPPGARVIPFRLSAVRRARRREREETWK